MFCFIIQQSRRGRGPWAGVLAVAGEAAVQERSARRRTAVDARKRHDELGLHADIQNGCASVDSRDRSNGVGFWAARLDAVRSGLSSGRVASNFAGVAREVDRRRHRGLPFWSCG